MVRTFLPANSGRESSADELCDEKFIATSTDSSGWVLKNENTDGLSHGTSA